LVDTALFSSEKGSLLPTDKFAQGGVITPNYGTLARFGNGGLATTAAAQSQSIDLDGLESRIASAIGTIKVQNVASETTGVANRVQQIEDSASF
jgi:hypothetical protein